MATTPLNSALTASPSDSDKACHLLALLLSLGRPTRPSELAARCSAFPATAHLVQRLCSFANSPLSLSDDLLVRPSLLAVAGGALSTYSVKRKRFVLDCGFVPAAKRRLIVDFENVNEDNGARKSVICIPPKIHFYLTDYLGRRINMLTSDMAVGLDKPMFSSPLFIEDSTGPSSCGVKSIDNVEDQMETDIVLERNSVDNLEPIVPTMSKDLLLYNDASLHEINSLAKSCPEKSKERMKVPQKQLLKSAATMKVIQKDKISSRLQSLYGYSLEQDQAAVTPKVNLHLKVDQKTNSMVHKSKENCDDMHFNERKRRYKYIASKDQPEKKELPNFDSYMVEEEEGSGGYGTVYRARSNNERTRVAIKCPHANAHKSHVNNELRMLERFGGKNFVIKYEGCIKNGNSSCFVLQHVEHDRPEVLKKEIDVCGLQWYGYCLFKALASLHKQGVVHRDVKPGNFLFSRKANKGYLIDFNLSTDLHQKYGINSKSSGGFGVNSKDEKPMTAKTSPPITLRKLPSGKSLLTANGETSKSLKSTFDMKVLKKMAFSQMKANNYSGGRKIIKSQGADGSVITSVKDVTSTRTPSVERMREPLPCQGRKELINLVQEARESPNHEASSISALLRKRVPAPHVNVDGKLFHVTPMPMHSTTNGIGGPCLIRSKGLGKHKEGPCAGTKGFRAPEVLLRSPHQGPKIDIWNIKDIAKLRGSEDIWEVAKLHDRESSFPLELYNTDFLPSLKLKEWCRRNTKRPDFFEEIPRPLFDLVDKCLMVNPRVRISAEEALKHEFFAPCHEELRKHRLQRQV